MNARVQTITGSCFLLDGLWSDPTCARLPPPLLTSWATLRQSLGLSEPQGSSQNSLLSFWCLVPGLILPGSHLGLSPSPVFTHSLSPGPDASVAEIEWREMHAPRGQLPHATQPPPALQEAVNLHLPLFWGRQEVGPVAGPSWLPAFLIAPVAPPGGSGGGVAGGSVGAEMPPPQTQPPASAEAWPCHAAGPLPPATLLSVLRGTSGTRGHQWSWRDSRRESGVGSQPPQHHTHL